MDTRNIQQPAPEAGVREARVPNGEAQSVTGLFTRLTYDVTDLFRKEIALGRAEISQKVSQAGSGVAALLIGGAVLFAGVFILLEALVYGVALLLPPEHAVWLAPLLVGTVVAIIGFAMVQKGRSNLTPENLTPKRTVNSIVRDGQIAKEHI